MALSRHLALSDVGVLSVDPKRYSRQLLLKQPSDLPSGKMASRFPFFSSMKFLALSGSLRAHSINSALLRATVRLAPPQWHVAVFQGLGELPLFNPDRDDPAPAVVAALRSQVAQADALLIASPEYAHGVTGTMKNALDWLVSFEPFAGKPVAVFNASPRAHHADAALREILVTMAAVLIEPACLVIPLLGADLDEEGMVASATVAVAVRGALSAVHEAVVLKQPMQSQRGFAL